MISGRSYRHKENMKNKKRVVFVLSWVRTYGRRPPWACDGDGKGCSVGGHHWPLEQELYHMERLELGVRYSWE